jgi:hypothetical protein
MKHVRAVLLVTVVPCLFLLGALKRTALAAPEAQKHSGETIVSLEVAAVDEIAAEDASNHQIHIHHQRSAAKHFDVAEHLENSVNRSVPESIASSTSLSTVPSPGFYPADLSDPMHGKVLTAAQSNNIYVNCAASCWGSPSVFLSKLASSSFIHITDQYVGTTANDRYTVGTATSINKSLPTTLGNSDILSLVHTAAHAHGSGYDHVYHLFLRSGVDVCVSAGVCYSPNNMNTFVFCAYHASVDFRDIGHVLYTVEPFQNVPGCAEMQPSPNGALIDSTSSTLAHELIETITDPDPITGWFAENSAIIFGAEIGDICVNPFGKDHAVSISGKSYAIQAEYSNKYHACATTP